MSRQIVTITINGLALAQFAADNFDLDITDNTVTMTCAVPNTQEHPVTIDDRTSAQLGANFTSKTSGQATTLVDLSQPRPNGLT